MHNIEHTLGLRIIHVTLQLPALHHRAAVRYFHSVEFVFNDDGTFLRIALYCDAHGDRRRHRCRRSVRLRSIRRGRSCRTWCGWSTLRRAIGLRRQNRRLRPEKLRPQDDHAKRKQRCHQNPQFRRELILLSRRAHECASVFNTFRAPAVVSISSHFSGTGS